MADKWMEAAVAAAALIIIIIRAKHFYLIRFQCRKAKYAIKFIII